jgi:hypothetical protein
VRPILEHRCFSCHAKDGEAAAEHDFSRFETLHAQRGQVATEVSACAMPPPGSPALTPDEAGVLLRWIACSAEVR